MLKFLYILFYLAQQVNLNKAVNQIEIFDTGVAFLAGAMIIPAVFVFSGTEGYRAFKQPSGACHAG